MITKKALECLKAHNDKLKKLSPKLDDMFLKMKNDIFNVFMSELKEFDNRTKLSLYIQSKYTKESFDEYYNDISRSITRHIMVRLQKDDKECAKILKLPLNKIPDELDKFVNNLIHQEIQSVIQIIKKSILYIKEFYKNSQNTNNNLIKKFEAENKKIKKLISENKYREQIDEMNIKNEILLSILILCEPN